MRWDIFCRVIDNYGDAGVCWRLANDLSARGENVILWIDNPRVLDQLSPNPDHPGVDVRNWPAQGTSWDKANVADVVIEAFACDPPPAYVSAMAQRSAAGKPPAWINLEYLSAEDWVEAHHRLPSPHPKYPLIKYFYFPGFTAGSGGLIREPGTIEKLVNPTKLSAVTSQADQPLRIFIFTYEQPGQQAWINALTNTVVSIAPCAACDQIETGGFLFPESVLLNKLPFVPQSEFDHVLAGHDLLFVRGEDSFVRAQWVGKPVFWHIYPQSADAHIEKLKAFYAIYLDPALVDRESRETLMRFLLAWNGDGDPSDCGRLWPEILSMLPVLQENALRWRQSLLKQADLVTQLQAFVAVLVK